MMNNSTANKNHIPCQTWAGQNGWSTTTSEQLLINQHTSSHHLGLGSSSEQRTLYNLSHTSSQSCINDPSTLTSRNNNPHTALYNDPRMSNITLSNLLYDNTAVSSAAHSISFSQQSPHTSSMMIATNQEKAIPPPSLSQQNQGPQPCRTQDLPFIAPNSPLKALFHSQISSQCLPNRLQDFPISLQSCEQHINTTQASFGGQNMESVGITGYAHSSASSSTSQERSHWVPSSHSGAGKSAVTVGAGHPEKETSQEEIMENMPKSPQLVNNEKSRSAILQKRAQLLKQLERMDELLQSLPPDYSDDEMVPETPDTKQTNVSDGYHIQLPPKEENEDESVAEDDSDHEGDPDYMPHSEGSDSDCPSDTDPRDSHPLSSPSTPATKRNLPVKEEMNESENQSTTPPKKKHRINQKNILKAVVLSTSAMEVGRDYDVRNYCLFCSKPMTKLARHLERVHSDKPEVAIAFQYPLHSKERKEIWRKIRIEGNFAHNRDVLRTGEGQLAVRVRPRIPTKAVDFIHCIYCRALFKKSSLYGHMSKCPEKAKIKDGLPRGRKSIISQSVLLTVDCDDLGISESMKKVLSEMNYDDVTRAVMGDRILLQYGEQMCEDHSHDVEKYQYIRQNLRQIARLLLEAQKTTSMQNMEDFFHPSNFEHVVSAVNVLAGYDADKKAFSIPSLAIKLGYNLQKTCCIVEDNATESGHTDVAESARSFLSLYQQKWSKLISIDALKNLKETKQKNKKPVPFAQFAEDVKLLHTLMENVHRDAEKKLRDGVNKENYGALARIVLARTIVFNKRETREIATMPVTAFESRKKSTNFDEMDVSVSELEKTLCGFFTRVDIRGSCGRVVPILLKPCFESSMELLVSVRKECGILSNNPFIFARPSTLSAYRGTDCLRGLVKECGAKNPEALTSKNMRKRFTKMLQLINLNENEAKQIFGPKSQIPQQSDDDDADMESGEEEEASTGHNREASSTSHGPNHRERRGERTSCKMTAPSKPVKKRQGHHQKSKLKWDEAEVSAVEKHMMRFIKEHKVPQKNDCVQCLEAEPHALKARSWKGVKDYVRNRITTLQRQKDSSRDLSRSKKGPRQKEQQQGNVKLQPSEGYEYASGSRSEVYSARSEPAAHYHQQARGETTSCDRTAPHKSTKSKEKAATGVHHKGKIKWDETEVRAVEKHMMRFIKEHKVPQKDDCVQCLSAEPHALKARSWKGVKDYVRNRITSLQRLSRSSKNSSKKQNRSRHEEQFLQNVGYYHQL
ncbi:uncharacterized protein LOC121648801 isoform X2 [Melanotaenia boesemani]|uniref:uncharacterized protein LOC121648801 isoform X2 n=1 Tax=Melanotaenia boesemani TaxID=1250792 RepID=UPI001C05EAA5|nr:uncharacterized protein LOC121648801 isoform X2 [Melanotaenia boesemani]